MKPTSGVLIDMSKQIDSMHGEDSDWWKGYVAGLKRAASIAEVHEAFEHGESCGG